MTRLFQQTLEEEKETDKKLTKLADSEINIEAEEDDKGARIPKRRSGPAERQKRGSPALSPLCHLFALRKSKAAAMFEIGRLMHHDQVNHTRPEPGRRLKL